LSDNVSDRARARAKVSLSLQTVREETELTQARRRRGRAAVMASLDAARRAPRGGRGSGGRGPGETVTMGPAWPLLDTSHILHVKGESLFVTPDGDSEMIYHDYMAETASPPRPGSTAWAGLRRGRGPLGKCSRCDVLPANLKVIVGGDEMETERHG
jgi:hypothetical protein